MIAQTIRGRRRGRSGIALVEFALVLTVFLSIVLGILEYAQVMMARSLMYAAADTGARLAASGTSVYTTADVRDKVNSILASQRLSGVTVQVYACDADGDADPAIPDWTDAPFGTGIAVEVDADFPALLPRFGILPNPIHMQSKAIACSEAS